MFAFGLHLCVFIFSLKVLLRQTRSSTSLDVRHHMHFELARASRYRHFPLSVVPASRGTLRTFQRFRHTSTLARESTARVLDLLRPRTSSLGLAAAAVETARNYVVPGEHAVKRETRKGTPSVQATVPTEREPAPSRRSSSWRGEASQGVTTCLLRRKPYVQPAGLKASTARRTSQSS